MGEGMVGEQDSIKAARSFEEWYAHLQDHIPHVSTTPTEETHCLVDSRPNETAAVHRWYTLKESFSVDLPWWLCERMRNRHGHIPRNVLDPFVGAGTTGVALGGRGIMVTGVEYNPFISFVSSTKASVTRLSPVALDAAIVRLEAGACRRLERDVNVPIPNLVTLHNRAYSDERDVRHIVAMRRRIRAMRADPAIKAVLLLGLGATVESAFHLRKDGRALRHVRRQEMRPVLDVLRENWQRMLDDVRSFLRSDQPGCEHPPLFDLYAGSAVDLATVRAADGTTRGLGNDSFDTVIYSPPYLNRFDYSEVYKLELWLLGFIESYEAWKQLRLGTIRSHDSIRFPETRHLVEGEGMADIADWLQRMGDSPCLPDDQRARIARSIRGYFDDMYQALKEQWRVLKPGGILAYVVANSRTYYLPIATDVILAEIARRIGFDPLELVVLRKRNGRTRQKLFLRESAVLLRKPN